MKPNGLGAGLRMRADQGMHSRRFLCLDLGPHGIRMLVFIRTLLINVFSVFASAIFSFRSSGGASSGPPSARRTFPCGLQLGWGDGRFAPNHKDHVFDCSVVALCLAGSAGGRWQKRPKIGYHATIVDLAGAKRINAAKGTRQRQVGAPGLGPGGGFLAHDITDQRRSGQ